MTFNFMKSFTNKALLITSSV